MSIKPNGKRVCSVCSEEKITYQCKGCANDFCYKHLVEHRQVFIEQLGEVETDRDQFHEILIQERNNLPTHKIMQKINKWEVEALKKIKQTAEECRGLFMEEALRCFNEIESRLNYLRSAILQTREENEFNEIILEQLRMKLTKLIEDLAQAPNISLRQDSSPYINKISLFSTSDGNELSVSGQSRKSSSDSLTSKYIENGITIAGGNGQGGKSNQLGHPQGIFVDDDLTVYIADTLNNRILKWKQGEKDGQVIVGGKGKGDGNDQLDGPTSIVVDKKSNSLIISDWGNRRIIRCPNQKNASGQVIVPDMKCCGLAMDSNGNLYVADWKKNEVKRWKIGEKDGTVVAGGNGQGNNLNQLNHPTSVFVSEDFSVYVTDQYNHRVVKWNKGAKEGVIVAGHKGQGNGLSQLSRPQGISVDQSGQIYVADCDNHRVVRLGQGDTQGVVVIGAKGQGDQSFQLSAPFGVALDREGHLCVVDSDNHRIQKYQLVHN